MANTAAQRQADYRARRATAAGGSGERRLNTWVSMEAHVALARIARRYGVTQREVLERFILGDDQKILAGLDMATPESDGYFDCSQEMTQATAQSAPIKRDAVTDHGAVKAPSYGMLESRVVLLNAENIGLADKLQAALDEVAALKHALAKSQSVTRHGGSTMKNPRRNP